MTNKLNDNIVFWLASYFNTNDIQIREMLDSQLATSFLMIWPIMENKVFGGFFKSIKISDFVDNHYLRYEEFVTENGVKHFYNRYKDKNKLRNLCHSDRFCKNSVKLIIEKDYNDLSNKEKLTLMLFVVYRFRNNIFHGNKGIKAWRNYTTEINFCINFMMKVIDVYNSNINV